MARKKAKSLKPVVKSAPSSPKVKSVKWKVTLPKGGTYAKYRGTVTMAKVIPGKSTKSDKDAKWKLDADQDTSRGNGPTFDPGQSQGRVKSGRALKAITNKLKGSNPGNNLGRDLICCQDSGVKTIKSCKGPNTELATG